MYVAKPGHSLIEVVSIETLKRFGPEVLKKVLLSGGMFAVHIPMNGVMNLPMDVMRVAKRSELDCLQMLEGSSTIQVVKEFGEQLSSKDMDALLLHEEGHIRHGHERPEHVAGKQVIHGILVDLQAELDADAYAAKRVGKRQMAIALTHAIEVTVNMMSTKFGTVPRDEGLHSKALTAFMMNEQFRTRIAALQ